MKRRHICSPVALLPGLVLLTGAAGGCTWYRPPALKIVSVDVTERTDQGLVLTFDVDATNDNNVPLPLREVRYSVDLGGRRVFSGTRSPEATLRARGTQELRLPAAMPLSDLRDQPGAGDVTYRLAGRLTYATPGQIAEVLFDTGVQIPTVDFSETGKIRAGTLRGPVGTPGRAGDASGSSRQEGDGVP